VAQASGALERILKINTAATMTGAVQDMMDVIHFDPIPSMAILLDGPWEHDVPEAHPFQPSAAAIWA